MSRHWTDEIFFRDTTHDLLAWALATDLIVVLIFRLLLCGRWNGGFKHHWPTVGEAAEGRQAR